jgi:hypothetical protein
MIKRTRVRHPHRYRPIGAYSEVSKSQLATERLSLLGRSFFFVSACSSVSVSLAGIIPISLVDFVLLLANGTIQ